MPTHSAPVRASIKWIPVDAELPDADTSVLVWSTDLDDAVWAHHSDDDAGNRWNNTITRAAVFGVTHWIDSLDPPDPALDELLTGPTPDDLLTDFVRDLATLAQQGLVTIHAAESGDPAEARFELTAAGREALMALD